MNPIKILITKDSQIKILWSDGLESKIDLKNLRRKCPCATCLKERSEESSSYIPLYHSDQITIQKINFVGQYALGIEWKDGHNTGIYEFPFLRSLGNPPV